MADQFINIAKPFLIEELTKQIKEHAKDFDVVESKINSIITQLKTKLEPISKLTIAGIKSFSLSDPTEKLQKLSDELKLKMDGIDFSELENIPDIDKTLTDRIKALPDKVKTKLKDLVDELVTGKAPAAAAATTEAAATTTEAAATTTEAAAETTGTAAAETTGTAAAAETTGTAAAAETTGTAATTAINDALKRMTEDDKKKTQHASFEGFINAGVFGNITELIAAAKAYENKQSSASVGGAKRKHRRKTKKNIRRNKNAKTRFGRTF